jgi:hypothetical protein
MISVHEDEVLFAVAEEIGLIFDCIEDKTVFLPTLEALAKHDETVVREQSAKTLTKICKVLSDAEI